MMTAISADGALKMKSGAHTLVGGAQRRSVKNPNPLPKDWQRLAGDRPRDQHQDDQDNVTAASVDNLKMRSRI